MSLRFRVIHFGGEWYSVHYSKAWWMPEFSIKDDWDEFDVVSFGRAWPRLFSYDEARRFVADMSASGALENFLEAQRNGKRRIADRLKAKRRAGKNREFRLTVRE